MDSPRRRELKGQVRTCVLVCVSEQVETGISSARAGLWTVNRGGEGLGKQGVRVGDEHPRDRVSSVSSILACLTLHLLM